MVLKILWHANQKYMESLKCGAGEGWKDQLDRSCEKWRSVTQSEGGKEYPTCNEMEKG